MTRIAASKARDDFSETLERVARGGERIVLRERGKDVAALVPMADLALIERHEDEIDVKAARRALTEMRRKGVKPLPYEKVREKLGLK